MLRKGFVERQIEGLARTLFLLKRREEEDDFVAAALGLKNACKELTGIPWNLVRTMTTPSLLGLLKNEGRLDAGRTAVVATLLHEQGMRDEAAGDVVRARSDYQKALALLRIAMADEPVLRTDDFERRVTDLTERLTPKVA